MGLPELSICFFGPSDSHNLNNPGENIRFLEFSQVSSVYPVTRAEDDGLGK
jgi:hypothetical protein